VGTNRFVEEIIDCTMANGEWAWIMAKAEVSL